MKTLPALICRCPSWAPHLGRGGIPRRKIDEVCNTRTSNDGYIVKGSGQIKPKCLKIMEFANLYAAVRTRSLTFVCAAKDDVSDHVHLATDEAEMTRTSYLRACPLTSAFARPASDNTPPIHQATALLEQIAAPISGLHFVANHMRQRRLGDLARKIGALGRLITKRGAEAIGRKVGTVSPGEQS
jgi:hypothetical protein